MTSSPFAPPVSIREITRTLEQAGFEAWCVGGAVRDALLGIDSLDWDVATSARPEQVQKLFRRTVPVGLKFGTVGVLDRAGVLHEVTTFRHDVETDGRHAVVKYGATLEEDLARRDFTINAIAVHAERLEVRDPFDGRGDLERRLVRAVGDAAERMREDRLRALRALRFAGRFGFEIDPATWRAIQESAPHLGRLSMERVKQELDKIMEQVRHPSATMERYREAGVFAALIPALADAPSARFRSLDHLARPGLPRRPDRGLVRFAALFVEPADDAFDRRRLEAALRGLKCSNDEVRVVLGLATSVAALDPARLEASIDDVALRKLVARAGRLAVPGVARLLWARAAAEGRDDRRTGIALYRRALRIAWRDPLTVADLAIDGDDLRAAGIPDGRAIGEALARLLAVVLEDPRRNTREGLLALLAAP